MTNIAIQLRYFYVDINIQRLVDGSIFNQFKDNGTGYFS